MKTFMAMASSALALASTVIAAPSLTTRATSLTPITIKGNAFFKGTDRFYIRGVDYQPGGSSDAADPLSDSTVCQRDIAEFKKLGINTVRIYTIDNTANHDACMQELQDAGIYLVLDVNTPKYSINRKDPSPSYNEVYLQSIFATIDAFASYSNVLAFFSGNEIINDDNTTECAPYIKAVTRDMRGYLKAHNYRQIPVGYSAADIDANRMEQAHYLNCGTDDVRSDFFAFNDYSWCAPSSFQGSGWDVKVKNFTGYGIPIFLSEYGCIKPKPRTFEEVASLYGSDMTAVYSGGLAYEYSEGGQGYGLVEVANGKVTEGDGFNYLKKAFANTPAPTGDGGYSATGAKSDCPAKSAHWVVEGDNIPVMPAKAKAYFTSGAGKGPGLAGSGSQSAGTPSTSSTSPGSSSGSGSASAASSSGAANGLQMHAFDSSPLYLGAALTLFMAFGGMLL